MLCIKNPPKRNTSFGMRPPRLENGEIELLTADAHELEERSCENRASIQE
jgi:hypothetical protein